MATFDEFLTTLESDLLAFVGSSWNTYKTQAIQDGNAFVKQSKADLEKWTKLLAHGDLKPDEFQWLVQGKKDLAELVELKLAGLGKAALDGFTNGLIDTIITTAFKVFL